MARVAVERENLFIRGPAGRLEALLEYRADAAPRANAVICHPHPLYGGTLDNKVAFTLARAAVTAGAAALRFNFRGVGGSEGGYDAGRGELADFHAVERWLEARYHGLPRWRLGFSFGAAIVIRAAVETSCAVLVSVAPPVDKFRGYGFGGTEPQAERWLLVQGASDEVVSPRAVVEWAHALAHPPEVQIFEGVGHFFHGHLTALRERVLATLSAGQEEAH